MENWIQKVISKWRSEGVKLNPPATNAEIENAEAILNFKFPVDFKEFYLQVDGFDEWDVQKYSFSIWPLDRIIEEYKENGDTSFVGFGDWLVRCDILGFVKDVTGIFKDNLVDPDSRPIDSGKIITAKDIHGEVKQSLYVFDKVANTFAEVIFMMNDDSEILK